MNIAGEIQLIIGPMFSGKSTELIRRIRRYTVAKRKCLVVKYQKDTRYSSESMATHDRQQWMAMPCEKLEDLREIANSCDVIGIDEGQFFQDIISFTEEMANHGKIVIVAALDGTFQRKPFGKICELIPLAESVVKLTAICQGCQNPASFSKRLGDEKEIELIGGSDKYIATCRNCFNDTLASDITSLNMNTGMKISSSSSSSSYSLLFCRCCCCLFLR